jgi:hypothetical protein
MSNFNDRLLQQQAEEVTDRADKSPAYMYKKMLLLQKQKNERKQLRYAKTLHWLLSHILLKLLQIRYPNYAPIRTVFDLRSLVIHIAAISRSMTNISEWLREGSFYKLQSISSIISHIQGHPENRDWANGRRTGAKVWTDSTPRD